MAMSMEKCMNALKKSWMKNKNAKTKTGYGTERLMLP